MRLVNFAEKAERAMALVDTCDPSRRRQVRILLFCTAPHSAWPRASGPNETTEFGRGRSRIEKWGGLQLKFHSSFLAAGTATMGHQMGWARLPAMFLDLT